MALAPQFTTHRFGSALANHTLELYLDIICPYSLKQLDGVRNYLLPLIENNKLVGDNLTVIIRQTPQPWHASSTLVHEAALVVSSIQPDLFKPFFFKLIAEQKAYYDEPTANETPNETRERLAKLAETVGIDKTRFLEAARLTGLSPNGGTSVTANLKLAIKYGRQNGVHVTPSVALDGLLDPSISSSFSQDDWKNYLIDKILPAGASKF